MKRARVVTQSATVTALANSTAGTPVVPPVALSALVAAADATRAQIMSECTAAAAHSRDMVARKDDSVHLARGAVAGARACLVQATNRVGHCAWRRKRNAVKHVDAAAELASITAKQLRALGVTALAARSDCVLGCVSLGCAAIARPPLVEMRAVAAFCPDSAASIAELCGSGSNGFFGDGWLYVVHASGPGLEWCDPHSYNQFGLRLAHADGQIPLWLANSDVSVSVFGSALVDSAGTRGTTSIDGTVTVPAPTAGDTRSELVGPGTLAITYTELSENDQEIAVQVHVCGTVVCEFDGGTAWRARVRRRPRASHSFAAKGVVVRRLRVADDSTYGLAVSYDEKWLVMGLYGGTLHVHSLPGGELVRSFGGRGDGPLQFNGLHRLCFAPNGNLIVADDANKRLQEVTVDGMFVRCIAVGAFGVASPFGVDVLDDTIAVSCVNGDGLRVKLFDFATGDMRSQFGEVGTVNGRLSEWCTSIRFTNDGGYVVVAELEATRLSVFSTAGDFVMCFGEGVVVEGAMDVVMSAAGDFIVSDRDNHRVCVFAPDGSELLESWEALDSYKLNTPIALCAAGKHLYILDEDSGVVTVMK